MDAAPPPPAPDPRAQNPRPAATTATAAGARSSGGSATTDQEGKTQQSLREQIADANRATAITEMASERDINWGKYLRHKRAMTLVVLITAICALAFFVYWSIGSLARDHAGAYKWWNDPSGYGGTQETPYPNGIYPDMTVPTVAVAASYPGVAWVQGLMFKSTTPKRSGCFFLLKMASQYGYWTDGPLKGSARLHGVHWNGSSDQLRFESMHKFLPMDAVTKYGTGEDINYGYVWASWNQLAEGGKGYANPWAMVIWTDIATFQNCPMITGYYAGDAKYMHFMYCLFEGGLCTVAMDWFDNKTDPDQVIDEMFSSVSGEEEAKCSTAAVASSAIQFGSMGFSMLAILGCSIDALNPFLGIGLGLLGGGAGATLGATVLKPKSCGTKAVSGW